MVEIPVTIWSHPSWDSKLILTTRDGAFAEHRKLAEGHLGDGESRELLKHSYGATMESEQLIGLREFDG